MSIKIEDCKTEKEIEDFFQAGLEENKARKRPTKKFERELIEQCNKQAVIVADLLGIRHLFPEEIRNNAYQINSQTYRVGGGNNAGWRWSMAGLVDWAKKRYAEAGIEVKIDILDSQVIAWAFCGYSWPGLDFIHVMSFTNQSPYNTESSAESKPLPADG